MLPIIISFGLTLFLISALVIVLLQRRTSAEARLYGAVRSNRVDAAATTLDSDALLSGIAGFVTGMRKKLGFTDTSGAARQLASAGYRNPEHVEIFYAAKLLLPAITAIVVSVFVKESPVFWFIAGTALAYYMPDFFVTRMIRKRREAIRMALPDALDLLAICMEAGLGLDQALMRVGAEIMASSPELGDEFRLINLEQRAGTPRLDAWRHMADRTQLEIISSFVSMLVQTDRFGTAVSKSLAVFSDTLRVQRRQRAEELAAKTAIKMVFPLVLFIFPSMFIVLLAPAIISIVNNMQKLFS